MEYRDVLEEGKGRLDKARLHRRCDEMPGSLSSKNPLPFSHLTLVPHKHRQALVRRH